MASQRQPGLRLYIDGEPVRRASNFVLQLEVEERADDASSFRMMIDMSPIRIDDQRGDWDVLEHGEFARARGIPRFALLHRVTVELSLASEDPDEAEIRATVLDGYITAVEAGFGAERVPDSQLEVTGIDASCLLDFETVTREWHGKSDAEIAREIFASYGFAADVEATAPARELARATLVQRCTDAEFLRLLARRNGFETWVEHTGDPVTPGGHAGTGVVGHFHSPRPDGALQPALTLFPREAPSLIEYRARWDSHQPTRIRAFHIDERTRRVRSADVTEPGYGRMGDYTRSRILSERLRAVLPQKPVLEAADLQLAAAPHDAQEVSNLARAELRHADWLVCGSGTVRGERYPAIVRPRRPIELQGAGQLLDGRWYVQGVRHRWGVDPDQPRSEAVTRRYEADVRLVRNALGGLG